MSFDQPGFWLAALQIIWIDILLSGDNAVVIALACRHLPPQQRLWGMILGAGTAVALRIVFAGIVTELMNLPYLKLVGAALLVWVAVKLVVPAESHAEGELAPADNLWRAVRIIAVADAVMSLDNVIAIAAVARGELILIVFGLIVSIPLIVAGSAMLMRLLERYPVMIWVGAGLLGWVAGEIVVSEPLIVAWYGSKLPHALELAVAASGALLVLAIGWFLARRRRRADVIEEI
ncbi:MAG: TerC family protein [Bacteroidales bacterium]|nr:TerC family protein [Bacteroidales bacterium]